MLSKKKKMRRLCRRSNHFHIPLSRLYSNRTSFTPLIFCGTTFLLQQPWFYSLSSKFILILTSPSRTSHMVFSGLDRQPRLGRVWRSETTCWISRLFSPPVFSTLRFSENPIVSSRLVDLSHACCSDARPCRFVWTLEVEIYCVF